MGQNVFVKRIDAERANDSIALKIDEISSLRLSFRKSSYWCKGYDTTLQPALCDSYFNLYKDKRGISFVTICNEYFIYGPVRFSSEALDFVEHNWELLYGEELRPDSRDEVLDTLKIRNPETGEVRQKIFASNPMTNPADGGYNTVEIQVSDSLKELEFSEHRFDRDWEYYKYNSKAALYPLNLLLRKERSALLRIIEWKDEAVLENTLKGEEKFKHKLQYAKEQIGQYKEWMQETRKERRKWRRRHRLD